MFCCEEIFVLVHVLKDHIQATSVILLFCYILYMYTFKKNTDTKNFLVAERYKANIQGFHLCFLSYCLLLCQFCLPSCFLLVCFHAFPYFSIPSQVSSTSVSCLVFTFAFCYQTVKVNAHNYSSFSIFVMYALIVQYVG